MDFTLSSEQTAILDMTRGFAADRIAPFALDWDAEKHFPTDVLAEAGALGLGGIYVRDEVGGSGLGRLDAVLIWTTSRSGFIAPSPRPASLAAAAGCP